jgi:cytoskeletal protein CcmA (bactofilin family)
MPTQVQWRRGTTTQNNSFTGAEGELSVDTTLDTLRVHDGSTAGGHRLFKYSEALGLGTLSDPNDDSILFWDDSAGSLAWMTEGTGLTVSGTSISISHLGLESLADPNADRIVMWDDSAGALQWVTIGSNLTLSGTTLSADYDGDITGVTAGDGLSGGGTSGGVTLALDLNELTAATVDVANDSIAIIDAGDSSSKKEAISDLVSGIAGTGLSESSGQLVVGTLNQDTTGNAATFTATANNSTDETVYPVFVDGATGSQGAETDTGLTYNPSSGNLGIGGSLTAATLDISGDVDVDGTLETDALTIGGATLEATVEAFFSASDAGGDGSFSYSSGVFTYTGPSAAEVRAHITAGTGVSISSGAVAIGQAVATSSDVTFADVAATGNVTITGNLDVNGTTTTLDTTNSTIADRLIELGTGTTGTPANDMGLVLERGSSDNAFIGWDESADKFLVGTGSFTGASTGDLTVTTGTLVANIEGNVTGNLTGTADLATSVTATANNSTDETAYITFVDGATGTQGIETDTGFTYNPASGALSVENADAGSSAGPEFTFVRNSSSPADADYLGQLKFSGEDDGGGSVVYSKITGKAGDVTDGTEDGIIEFAAQKAGTSTLLARLKSDKLELVNSTALDVDGAVTAASLDISGSADIDGTMEADAYTVDGTALSEYIADTVGAMFSSNTETGITATYEDADNTIDLVVADVALGSGTSGNYVANVTAGTGLAVSGSAGEGWAPAVALSHLGLESLTDPDADKFMIWDDSAGATAFATLGDGLSSDGTTINGIAVYNSSGTKLN